jgi:protein-tyrosine phosphatase
VKKITLLLAISLSGLLFQNPAYARISGAQVERSAAHTLSLSWTSPNPIDVYEGTKPDISAKTAHRLARATRSGKITIDAADSTRRYFLLIDGSDHQRVEVAERLVPLEQGSNFRDIGGYTGAGGKHVRWGRIYRSGGQPLLSPADVDQVKALGVAQLVDLRSSEERVIAPSKITGIPYAAVGYSMSDLMGPGGGQALRNGADVYHPMPHLLAPQLRLIFRALLNQQSPVAYNCSAGQDRTGFATAVILSALGVSRDQILTDYHLSTKYRRPEFEMPEIDAAAHPNDPVAQMFAMTRKSPNWKTPSPLMDEQGRPFLRGAFDEIDAKWGSLDAYLAREVGISHADVLKLRLMYLE